MPNAKHATSTSTMIHLNRTSIITTASIVLGAHVAWISWRLVRDYGWDGTRRLIWEGDHLKPEVRDAMDMLDGIEFDVLPKKQNKCISLETATESASLDTVDGGEIISEDESANNSSKNSKTIVPGKIRTSLGILSDDVDKLAAKLDSVESHGNAEVRQRKKSISKHLVVLMERVDALISKVQTE